MWSRYERARKYQLEQKAKREGNTSETERDLSAELEKGDLLALFLSGFLTIFPISVLLLFLIVVLSMLFMRIL